MRRRIPWQCAPCGPADTHFDNSQAPMSLPDHSVSAAQVRRRRGAGPIMSFSVVRALCASALLLMMVRGFAASPPDPGKPSDDPKDFIQFVLDDSADCLIREGQHIAVRNTHPQRTIRVWLDRYFQNVGTGDRSHTDLLPAAEPEGLGCSTVMNGKQEWRVVRAKFLD